MPIFFYSDSLSYRRLGVRFDSLQRADLKRIPYEPVCVRSDRVPEGLPVQRFGHRLGISKVNNLYTIVAVIVILYFLFKFPTAGQKPIHVGC